MGVILRLARLVAAGLALTFLAVVAWTALWPFPSVDTAPEAEAILCLGGGVEVDGSLGPDTWRRAETCAALHLAGKAPVIVMSAGPNPGGTVPGAVAMADVATRLGVPDTAVVIEERSYSTLQNVLFARALTDAAKVIVVTEAFHLPRSWASARWAGFGPVHLVASERIRPEGGLPGRARMMVRETLAIWFNAVRALAYAAGGLAGIPADDRQGWLR